MSINLRNIAGSNTSLDNRRVNSYETSPSLLSSNFAIPVLSTMCSATTSNDSIKSKVILPLTTTVHASTRGSLSALLSSNFAVPVLSTMCGIMASNDSTRREATLSLTAAERVDTRSDVSATSRMSCPVPSSVKLLAFSHLSRLGWLPKYHGLLLQDAIKFHFIQLFNQFYKTKDPLHPELSSLLMELLIQLKNNPFHEINKRHFDEAQIRLFAWIKPDTLKKLKIKEDLESLRYLSSCGELPPTIRVIDLIISTVHIREEEIRSQSQAAQLMNLIHSIDFFFCGNASAITEHQLEMVESAPSLSLTNYPKAAAIAIAPLINAINQGIKRNNKAAKVRTQFFILLIQQFRSITNKKNQLKPKTIQYAVAQIQILINFFISEYNNVNYLIADIKKMFTKYLSKSELAEIEKRVQTGLLKSFIETDKKEGEPPASMSPSSTRKKQSLDSASIESLRYLYRNLVIEESSQDLEFLNLFQYFLTSYQTSLMGMSTERNIEDLWLQFHDHHILSCDQKRKKPTRETPESKEEFTTSITKTSPQDSADVAFEDDEFEIEIEESEVEERRSFTKGSCSQWLDPLCRTLATSLSSMPKESSIAQKNANYHLRVLSLRLDLLHSCHLADKHDLFPTLGWGMIRNCANILEQTLVNDILRANPDQEMTEHSHVVLVRQLPTASISSATIQREIQRTAEFIDWGVVSSRYPHGTRQLCRRQNIAEPSHLNLLTNPWNDGNMHLLLNQLIGPILRFLESRSDIKVSESILKSLLERSSSSSETPPTAHPLSAGLAKRLNPLITKRLKALLNSSKAHAQTYERSSVPLQQKLSATWKDICYHLSGLQQQLRSWIAFPQSKYLIVHGDMILTHLQILDELMETALHAHLNKQELHMHDLEAFRRLRDHQEEPALSQIVKGLNVAVREHYPYGLRNSPLFAVQWRLTTLQASVHDPEDINADLVLSKGKIVKIAQLQQQLLENIEGIITMTEARMKEFV